MNSPELQAKIDRLAYYLKQLDKYLIHHERDITVMDLNRVIDEIIRVNAYLKHLRAIARNKMI